MRFGKIGAVVASIALLFGMSSCGTVVKTDQQTQALWYEDGVYSAQVFKDCIPAATRDRKGLGDTFYRYPIGDRTWSFTGREGSETGPIAIKTKDGQEMSVVGFLKFTLTEDCQALKKFHDRIGLKYAAYFNEDGSHSTGWLNFLNDYLAVPVNSIMDKAGLEQNWRTLYQSSEAQNEFEQFVQTNIGPEIDKTIGETGVIRVQLVAIETPQPSAELLQSLRQVEEARAQAQAATETAKAEAATAQAKAEADLAAQRAKNALIKAQYEPDRYCKRIYGADNCMLKQLVDSGKITLIPFNSKLHINMPTQGQ